MARAGASKTRKGSSQQEQRHHSKNRGITARTEASEQKQRRHSNGDITARTDAKNDKF
jgi:hypothetical protein